jgi:glycine cleavage system aminomethyltransferase T/glycine/D-amino acid oxidase-like deaminating enzyme
VGDEASEAPSGRDLPGRARVVVIGGGVIGTSTAYHLARLGWTDVVLLEQGQLSCGTTWHAAGLLGQLRATESGTRLVQYSAGLYGELEEETGLATGLKRCGGVTVARTPDRMVQLRRTAATADAYGLECELLTPDQALERYPILETGDLLGALWLPGDATVNPVDVTASLARGARQRGVRIFERTRVTGVSTERGRVTGVTTDRGAVEAEVVVNCAGQWAKAVGRLCGVDVPLHSAEHFYVVTEAIDGVHPNLPILRDPDGYTYVKEEVGGLVVGGFEPTAKPWVAPDALPYPFEFQLLDEDWDHFSVLMESALHRIPVLARTGLKKLYNGPESFTPDNQFILGEAPGLDGFFVGAGFNSVGIASGGGAGRALAEWIIEGEPTSDLVAVDIRRFASFNANNRWLRDRVGEVLGLHYAVPWPNRELATARPFRRSPLHRLLADKGAVFGSKMGWERPNLFAPSGVPAELDYTWGRPTWLEWSNAEQEATRQRVAVFDETSFGKLLVVGRDTEAVLQRLCTADVAVAPGRTVYTGMLNEHAGYEADVTMTRLADDRYLLVTSSASPVRDAAWIERHLRAGEHVSVVDVSSAYAVFGVMGPASRELLGRLSSADLSHGAFGFATSREISVGYATVRATRLTYVGELGWELFVPTEFAVGVYEDLVDAGSDLGLADAGYYAINSLRLDKGYRAFGSDLTPDRTPLEAGLRFTCKLKTPIDFSGRAALESAIAEGPRRRLVSLRVGDPAVMLWGGELVLHDGAPAGQVTSAAWSATFGAAVGLAYVWRKDRGPVGPGDLDSGTWEVVAGDVAPIDVQLEALYDPRSARVRS